MTLVRLSVLGATGFVGSALLRALAHNHEHQVQLRCLLRGDPTRVRAPHLAAISGELGDALPPALFFDRPHVLVHLATKQRDHDGTGFAINRLAAERLLEALSPHCVGIIYSSSASVYGQGAQRRIAESAPTRPQTALAESRLATERVLLEGARARGIPALILRPRFVVGRGDRYFLPRLAPLLQRGIGVGSGSQAFTFIDVDDYAEVIAALAIALQRQHVPHSQVLNAGYDKPITLAEIAALLGAKPRIRVPAAPSTWAWLRRHGGKRLEAIATQLELIGLNHELDVSALGRIIGAGRLDRDRYSVMSRALADCQIG